MVTLKVARTHINAVVPSKSHPTGFCDAAYDLYPLDTEVSYETRNELGELSYLILHPGQRQLVSTGIRFAIPKGYWLKIHERSGLANKGIHVLGGVIDSGYTAEVKVILYNSSDVTVVLPKNKAIAQFTVERLLDSELTLISTDDMSFEENVRVRKAKGFGSTDAAS